MSHTTADSSSSAIALADAAPDQPSNATPPAAPPQPQHAAGRPDGASVGAAVRRVLRQPRFLIAAFVLLVSGVGLNAASQFLQLHFRKQAVPLRVPSLGDPNQGVAAVLDGDKVAAGRWIQVTKDEVLNSDVEHMLGTKEHISRDYVDGRVLARLGSEVTAFVGKPPADRLKIAAEMRNQPTEDRVRFIEEVRRAAPEAVVKLHVAYYTGLVDTVAHIPDRCYVADGYEPTSTPASVPGPFGVRADGTPRDADFRFIHFEDQTGQGRVARSIGYLFHVNGEYQSNPLNVRARLQELTQKYGYYAKVELMITGTGKGIRDKEGPAKAQAAMKDFMTVALPEVERALPDWNQVVARK